MTPAHQEWRVVKWVISFLNYLICGYYFDSISGYHDEQTSQKGESWKEAHFIKQKGIWRPKHVSYNYTKEMMPDLKRAQIRTKHPACIPIMDKAAIDSNKNYSRFSLLLVVEAASSCSSLLTSLLDMPPHQKLYSKTQSRGKIRLSTSLHSILANKQTMQLSK